VCHTENVTYFVDYSWRRKKTVVEGDKLEIHSLRGVTKKKPVAKK